MPLEPGTQLGAYEILALIGRGGMGEVYRARDARLKRTVALKILPASFAGDPSRVARFQREAEVLASLNHPNIAAIYDLVGADGATALALEFVDGESLAERLAAGPLPIEAAVAMARQIASALAAAHAQGIVHRDLKPGNVVVRQDGAAKVLDFGLAKIADPEASADADATTLTGEVAPMTAAGVAVGTPAYMSPEQATGRIVDARTDIWAFGCVLFEMLSGRRAFDGATITDTLTAVLTRPPDWSTLPAATSPALRVLLRRCLSTDPKQRPASIDVVAFVLDEEQALSARGPTTPARARSRWWVPAAAVVIAAAGIAAGATWSRSPGAATAVVRTTIPASSYTLSEDRNFAFTSDSRLVYVSEDGGQLLARPLDALEPTPVLTTPAYLRGVYPSPDGRWIAFIENSFTIRKVPAAGGASVTLHTADGPLRGATWLPDDAILFGTGATDTGLQQVPAAGGPVTVVTRPDRARNEVDHLWPERLPGGTHVLFTITSASGGTPPQVAVLDLATRAWRVVVEGASRGQYVDSGHLVYVAAGSLWAIPFDLSRMATVGSASEVLPRAVLGSPAQFAVSPGGTLLYASGIRLAVDRVIPTWVTRHGDETPVSVPPSLYRHPRISPEGDRLAIDNGSPSDIYLLDLKRPRAQLERFTFAQVAEWFPVWTPDGRRILFGMWANGGTSNLFIQDVGGGTAERLTTSSDMQIPTAITPDGSVAFLSRFPRDIQALALTGSRKVITLVDSAVEERNVAVSPDGNWIAYEGESTDRSGESNIYVRPYPDVNRRVWQISTAGGFFPAWSHTGHEIYYAKNDDTIAAAAVTAAGGILKVTGTTDLFRGRYLLRSGTLGRHFDVARDGRFLMLKYERGTELGHFVLVQGWTSELKRLVR